MQAVAIRVSYKNTVAVECGNGSRVKVEYTDPETIVSILEVKSTD